MQAPTLDAPAVHVVLRAHPPAPARLGAEYQSAPLRALLAGATLAVTAAAAGLSAGLPPGYPWPALVLAAGLWTARYLWAGQHRVLAFTGRCPACARELRLRPGARIRLPFVVACTGCGAECELRQGAPERPARRRSPALFHFLPDCPGEWRSEWARDEGTLACTRCGARHEASRELHRQAAAENQQGELLARLADEGRYL